MMDAKLRKPSLLDVPKKGNPFENDKLGDRRRIAESLTRILSNVQQPFVITLEAPWGWGKSTFLRMWKQFLEEKQFNVVHLNAWETDYVEDPTIPILSDLTTFIEMKDQNAAAKLRRIGKRFINGTIVVSGFAKLVPGLKGIQEIIAGILQDRLKKIEEDKKELRIFKETLGLALKSISSKEQPLVVLVDELDRCRPTYAVLFLEKLKHLFSVQGVVFLLAIDADQLTDTVKLIYGMPDKAAAQNYLRRFVDYRFRLPAPSAEEFCGFLVESFGIGELLESFGLEGEKDKLISNSSNLFSMVGFGLREQEQCFTEIALALLSLEPLSSDDLMLVPLLATIKNDNYPLYRKLYSGQSIDEDFDQWIERNGNREFSVPIRRKLNAIKNRFSRTQEQFQDYYQNLRYSANDYRNPQEVSALLDDLKPYIRSSVNPIVRVVDTLELIFELRATSEKKI
jgi:hypothetical protein